AAVGLGARAVGAAAFAGWRATLRSTAAATRTASRPRSGVADLLGRLGLPAPAVAGVRMAHEPGAGRTAVPVRSMIAGAAIAVAVLAGVVTFVSSLDHLLATPRLYGWNWDLTIGDGYGPADASDVPTALQDA